MLKKYDICFAIIQKMFRKLILCLISALFLVLSWPPSGFPFLIFGAFVPIFFVIHDIRKKRFVFIYSFLIFALWNLFTTYWIYNASLFGAVAAICINSILMASVITLFFWIKQKFNDRRSWWAFISLWLSFEYLHFNWDLSWPWLTLGNAFAHYPLFIQWYEYTGTLGGSLWILLANIFLFQFVNNKSKYLLFSLVIVIPILFSFLIDSKNEKRKVIEIVVVQPNIDPYFEKFNDLSSIQQLEKFIQLAETELDSSTNYLIGPETAIVDGVWENNIEESKEIQTLIKLVEKYPQLNIIIGAITYKAYSKTDKISKTARQFVGSDYYYDVFNSAIQINTSEISVYNKSKLVQGVEFTPFPAILENLEFLAIDLGGITGSLGTQDYREVFKSKSAQMAPIICYESIFGDFIRQYVRNGADLFAIITNDGWWKNTPGYKQHLNYASLRAIECRRAIARSANTGISAFIDSKGLITNATKWDEEIVIKSRLETNSIQTFYVRFGDYIGRISAFIAVMFLCFTLAKRD
tara:strand:- start:2875 stop:4443 length:1569 start_codon:yes stop_codon:yes gene_type:complete